MSGLVSALTVRDNKRSAVQCNAVQCHDKHFDPAAALLRPNSSLTACSIPSLNTQRDCVQLSSVTSFPVVPRTRLLCCCDEVDNCSHRHDLIKLFLIHLDT